MKSIVSYPNRGPWGQASYRGNCSGHLIKELIEHFKPKVVIDPAEGSGTTKDVCQGMGVEYYGSDLRTGFDLSSMSIAYLTSRSPDFIFFHPPYFRIIKYSGKVWGDQAHPADLSQVKDWEEYLFNLRLMLDQCLQALKPGGKLAILIGDVRLQGSYYSAQAHILTWYPPSKIRSVIIKVQHNTRSATKHYSGRFIPILHEYCIVIDK